MKETSPERNARRAISKQLTSLINDAGTYGPVRTVVTKAITLLGERLRALSDTVKRDFQLNTGMNILIYYIKGGNALDAIIPPDTLQVLPIFEYGKSDWDTQIVINPWLPIAVQDALNAGIEDIVIDIMQSYGNDVARSLGHCAQDPLTPTTLRIAPEKAPSADNPSCDVKCDVQQSFRKVYERNRSGLQLFDSEPLKKVPIDAGVVAPANAVASAAVASFPPSIMPAQAASAPGAGQPGVAPAAQGREVPPPGIILNDAVKPFILYRLGYTWHATWAAGSVNATLPISPRPILMELIDVTLPRKNTVEAVTIWSDILRDHLLIAQQIDTPDNLPMPLPDAEYHLHENMTMICEIAADPDWRAADKLPTRREKVNRIYNWYARQGQLTTFYRVMNAIAGTAIAGPGPTCDAMIDTCRHTVSGRVAPTENPQETFKSALDAINQARQAALGPTGHITWLLNWLKWPTNTDSAFSDDLALASAFKQSQCINATSTPMSWITTAMVARSDYRTIEYAATKKEAELSDPGADPVYSLRTQMHTTMRPSGPSYECTMVVFSAPRAQLDARRAVTLLTLTTAGPVECPFVLAPCLASGTQKVAPLLDMGEQRKIAAALIQDFVQREALKKQHHVIGTLMP